VIVFLRMKRRPPWLVQQFQTLLEVPAYFRAIAKEWMNVLFGETLIGVSFLLWWALTNPSNARLIWVFVVAMFIAGYYAWRAASLRVQQKISVANVHRQQWRNEKGEATAYYFEVSDDSEGSTIHGVRVQLEEMFPLVENLDWLPVLLRQKHDNPPPHRSEIDWNYTKTFDLHPGEPKLIDFVSAWNGSNYFDVEHIAGYGVNRTIPRAGRHQLKVLIAAEDTPALHVHFEVWMDEGGILQCELRK
jgi:hypothetical protein